MEPTCSRHNLLVQKSTVEEIRQRFDGEVERFSVKETGQVAAVDSPLCLAMLTEAAAAVTPNPEEVLDLGCGAGNFTLFLLEHLATPPKRIRLVDLSQPMLDRAESRLREAGFAGEITLIQGDIREVDLGSPDIIIAAAVLHHLRTGAEWEATYRRIWTSLTPGGGLWVFDLISHEIPAVGTQQWRRYGEYLSGLRDEAYREAVFAYIEKEDTPAPLSFQLDVLRRVGFSQVDVLHANRSFAAFGAVR